MNIEKRTNEQLEADLLKSNLFPVPPEYFPLPSTHYPFTNFTGEMHDPCRSSEELQTATSYLTSLSCRAVPLDSPADGTPVVQ